MANDDVEIEIKVQLTLSEYAAIKERLSKIAKFVKTVDQSDEYFTPSNRNFLAEKYPYEWLSIRKRGVKNILNYKHFYPERAEVHTHCDEFETEVGDKSKLEKIFTALNITSIVTVEKQREVFLYGEDFEIALDNVKELGYFIEIETIKNFGTVENARKAIYAFAAELGIDATNEDVRGYPFLLMDARKARK